MDRKGSACMEWTCIETTWHLQAGFIGISIKIQYDRLDRRGRRKNKFSDRAIKWKRLLNNRSSGSYRWDNDFWDRLKF